MSSGATGKAPFEADEAAYLLSQAEISMMREQAVDAKARAYCPYSSFRVGCAVLAFDGTVYSGSNVENASYPVGICAERTALAAAVATMVRPELPKFRAIAVSTDITPPASPCGMCRQFIREFCPLHLPIYMFDVKGEYIVKTVGDLLPMSFGPDALAPPGAPGT